MAEVEANAMTKVMMALTVFRMESQFKQFPIVCVLYPMRVFVSYVRMEETIDGKVEDCDRRQVGTIDRIFTRSPGRQRRPRVGDDSHGRGWTDCRNRRSSCPDNSDAPKHRGRIGQGGSV